ncbi:MAG: hypothetical protein WA094_03250, partial [Candidatus Desulfobacillus denitrificans]
MLTTATKKKWLRELVSIPFLISDNPQLRHSGQAKRDPESRAAVEKPLDSGFHPSGGPGMTA